MSDELVFRFVVEGDDFTTAGQASVQVKKNLRQLGIDNETVRRVSIAMYEGEINMVIHAGGGQADGEGKPPLVFAAEYMITYPSKKFNEKPPVRRVKIPVNKRFLCRATAFYRSSASCTGVLSAMGLPV